MFATIEKQHIAAEVEKLLLSLHHPEMPKERPKFALHVEGKESWSWADIVPNWTFDGKEIPVNPFNEIARAVLAPKQEPPIEDTEVLWAMKKYGGDFVDALAEAGFRADSENLRRIKEAWPDVWKDYAALARKAKQEKGTK